MSINRITWLRPNDPPQAFPSIHSCVKEPPGLLAAGGDLSSERLLHAYRSGIFPWYEDGQPILWWSPDPRCVLRPRAYHVARRLKRRLATCDARVTYNQAFADVVRACAAPRRAQRGTWITQDMMTAYRRLHAEGWAHSVEVRKGERLIGGIYGLAIGRMFFAESMFSAEANASKIALLGLCSVLLQNDFELIDCQVVSQHLLTLGATTMPRPDFAATLDSACEPAAPFENWPDAPISVRELWLNWCPAALQ